MKISTKITARELSNDIFPEIYEGKIPDFMDTTSEFFYMLDEDPTDGVLSISRFRATHVKCQEYRCMRIEATKDHYPRVVISFDTRWSINDRVLENNDVEYSNVNAAFVLLSCVQGDEDKICNELIRSCGFRYVNKRSSQKGV